MSVVDDPSTSILGTTLVILVVIAGAAVLVLTGARGLRRLPLVLLADGGARGLTAEGLAASAGLASIAGAALAVQWGGPGALVWLWIAALLALGVAWLEAWLAHRGRPTDDAAGDALSPRKALFAGFGGAAPIFAGAHALALALAAIGVGALLHGQQAAAIAREVAGAPSWATSLALAAIAAPLVLGTGLKGQPMAMTLRRALLRVIPAAVGVYVLCALAVVLADVPAASAALRRALAAAFEPDAARGGLAAGAFTALTHAVLRATMTGVGIGALGPSPELAGARDREEAAARSMLTPAIALAVVGTLSALPILAQETAARAPIAGRELVSLEVHHSRGLLPSERGQTFVLPRDTPLEEGKRYAMVLRADPRGHKLGQLLREQNMIALPHWRIAHSTDTVIFRASDRRLADNPGFDVVVPVAREVATAASGREYLKLTPRDPKVNFRALMTALDLDGPYLVVGDYGFEAAVERALSGHPSFGEHLALYQPAEAAAIRDRDDPTLRELLAAGMRGPYLESDEAPLPDALVAAEGFTPAIGERVHLRMEAPARGLEIGFLGRTHELEVPAWDFLAATDTAILRSKTDPALDLRFPVHSRLVGDRLRFSSALPGLDFAKVQAITSHEGPYLAPPPYTFTVEAHSGLRLPEALRRRRTLIPVDGDPAGAAAPRHPALAEVLSSGMEGPFLDAEGAGALAIAWRRVLGAGAWAPAIAALLLAILGLWAWAGIGARAISELLGAGAEPAYRVLFLGLCALAGGVALLGLLDLIDVSVVIAGQLALLAMIAGLPQVLLGDRRR